MKDIIIAIITTGGLIVTGFFARQAQQQGKKNQEKIEYELNENSGKSFLDKMKAFTRHEINALKRSVNVQFDHVERRLDSFEKRSSYNDERMDNLDRRSSRRDETLLRVIDEIQEIRRITDKMENG